MVKQAQKEKGQVVLPKDVRVMGAYIANLLEVSILYNDPAFVYDLVAVLAWRANTQRGRMSSRLKASSAFRFVEEIDAAMVRWENNKRKLSARMRIYIYSALFDSACERAFQFMKRDELVGVSESTL